MAAGLAVEGQGDVHRHRGRRGDVPTLVQGSRQHVDEIRRQVLKIFQVVERIFFHSREFIGGLGLQNQEFQVTSRKTLNISALAG